MASGQMEVAALSRPFALGMLYDVRKDKLNMDFTLWDKETITNNKTTQNQTSSAYQITALDSIETKSSLLDVSASLKASFLGGLIEVGGSASYLNDNKKFKNQSRVTLQFKATTAFERLAMTHLDAKNRELQDIIKKSNATHVVTGIQYGAHAFFVFDSKKLESSSVENIGASMQATIKKIPSFDFEAKVDVKLSKEEKAVTDEFSCKFYGDFILDSNPSTFEDAVKTYSQLPKLLGGNGEKGVPVKVWLTPLKNLDPTAEEMKGEICVGLLRKAENALEIIKEMEMRCNDSLDEDVVQSFPQIRNKLKRFQNLCQDYTKKLRQTMMKTFCSIREGKEDETSLEKLLDDQEKSPFSRENLDKWLDNTEREINVIRSCVEAMKGIKITKDESEFDRAVFSQDVDDVLSFVFTSVETDDPYLDQMEKYLHSHDSHDKSFTPPTKDHWFFSVEVVANLRQKAEEFCSIAKGLKSSSRFSFIVGLKTNKKYKGATIYHYRKGRQVTEEFSKPAVPDVEKVKDRQNLIWYACDLTLDPNTANNYLILSEDNKKATCGAWQTYSDCPERFDTKTQVLCREGLTGRHYWEVEWSTGSSNNVGVAVTYQSIVRKGNSDEAALGSNTKSWYFGVYEQELNAWHNGKEWNGNLPSTGCSRVGVYLDWPAGTLSFYKVSHNTLSHFYTFHTSFTEAVYPGLWIYNTSNYAALRPV
ncbi:stonustoxin subunit beta-like [Pelmatolapia mariae]|uniref:stonustoxin subunit beta-like n=1 Tax=Pelmatolapia mariae TaxID=158779 RepID=UPI002FE63E2F